MKKDAKPAEEAPPSAADQIRQQLGRIKISTADLSGLRPPPEDPKIRMALSAGGVVVALAGAVMTLVAIPTLIGAFLCFGIGLTAYGVVTFLYGQWDGALTRRAMPRHPASGREGQRSVWETAMTVAVVLAIVNVPVLLLVTGLLAMFVHWTVALLVAVGVNVAAGGVAYLGDGENRRPLLEGAAAPSGAPGEGPADAPPPGG